MKFNLKSLYKKIDKIENNHIISTKYKDDNNIKVDDILQDVIKLYNTSNSDIFLDIKKCKFVYEDENKIILNNWIPITYNEISNFNDFNIIPYNVYNIGIYNDDLSEKYCDIDISKIKNHFKRRLYRVGLMSDIHYNDKTIDTDINTYTDDNSEYTQDIENALEYYQNKEDVKFICAAGDVSTDSIKHIMNFKLMIDEKAPDTDFYTCFGNHDFKATSSSDNLIGHDYDIMNLDVDDLNRLQAWNKLITPNESKYEIHYQDENTESGKTSYWFEVPIGKNKSDIYVFLSVNYGMNNQSTAKKIISYQPNISENVKITSNNFIVDTTKRGYNSSQICYDEGDDIILKFTSYPQRFYLTYQDFGQFATNKIKINHINITDGYGNDITTLLKNSSNPKVGFYGTDRKYHINSCEVNIIDNKLEFPISSSFSTYSLPITIKMNIDFDNDNDNINSIIENQNNINLLFEKTYELLNWGSPIERNNNQKIYDYQFYDSATLLWLYELIQRFKNKRIFIFTHQFFAHKAGNYNGYDNKYSYAAEDWRISNSGSYCLSGIQFDFLNKLNNDYKNTIWFTGHSHYKWAWQCFDKFINITNKEFDYNNPYDDDFNQNQRYLRKYKVNKLYEIYDTVTTKTGLILYTSIHNLQPGNYEIKLYANANYTIGRNIPTEANEGDNFRTFIYLNDKKIGLPIVFSQNVNKNNYIKTKFVVKENGIADIMIYKELPGSNWHTIFIKSIKNLDTNEYIDESLLNKFSSQYYSIDNPSILYAPYINIDKENLLLDNTAYNVHLPSTCRPLPTNITSYSVASKDSEGGIMDIYEDYVDIRGIVFKEENLYNGEYINKYHPLAQYRINIKAS